jgi:hypothetical protein
MRHLDIIVFFTGFAIVMISLIIILIKVVKGRKIGITISLMVGLGVAFLVTGIVIRMKNNDLISTVRGDLSTNIDNKLSSAVSDNNILGGWKGTSGLAGIVIFFEDKHSASISYWNEGITHGLYQLESLGNKNYKVHIYEIGEVYADTSSNSGAAKGKEVYTFLLKVKDKDHMEMSAEGSSSVVELKRIDSTLAKNILGIKE